MTHLLRIDSSIYAPESNSVRLTEAFARRWAASHPDGMVTYRNLQSDPVEHLTSAQHQAFSTPSDELDDLQRKVLERSDTLIGELQAADELVIGAPLYNFSTSSLLKTWIDHIARAGVTFRYTSEGPQGLLQIRKATVISTRGGRYAGTDNDHQTPYLRQVLGFLGIDSIEFVYAEGLAGSDDELLAAEERIEKLAA